MNKNRLEAFSDGVLAIILTLMILELKIPHSPDLKTLAGLWPVYTAYLVSFFQVLMMWMNHHAIFERIQKIDAHVLWANGLFLFAVSQVPFVTGYVGEIEHKYALPSVLYALVMMGVTGSIIYLRKLVAHRNPELTGFNEEIKKSWISFWLFGVGGAAALAEPLLALGIFAAIPLWRYFASPIFHDEPVEPAEIELPESSLHPKK